MFIRTHSLFLRPPWAEDAAELADIFAQRPLMRFGNDAPWPLNRIEPVAFFLQTRPPRWPAFLVTLPATQGVIVGTCVLSQGSVAGAELGCWIAPEARRRGYAKEALTALIETARVLGHGRLTAGYAPNDEAAAGLLRTCGLHPVSDSPGEATIRCEMPQPATRPVQPDWGRPDAYAAGIGAAA